MSFPDSVREKALLWSDRHCCVCGKQCGVMIELHHIVPASGDGDDSIDNALPVCFECHCHIQHYNNEHPRGSKYKEPELKKRREQIYELHTSRYVPPITVALTQATPNGICELPDVGFQITHLGGPFPAQAFVTVISETDSFTIQSEYYNGSRPWNMNPGSSILGHFQLPRSGSSQKEVSFRIELRLKDILEREHQRLPFAYTFLATTKDWYLEPSPRNA